MNKLDSIGQLNLNKEKKPEAQKMIAKDDF